jgi:hypothetical protein
MSMPTPTLTPTPTSMPSPLLPGSGLGPASPPTPAVNAVPAPATPAAAAGVPPLLAVWMLPDEAPNAVHALLQIDLWPYVGNQASPSVGDAVAPGSKLRLHRAYVGTALHMGGDLSVVINAELAPTVDRGATTLRPIADAYVAWSHWRWLVPVVGVMRVPVTRWALQPELDQPLPYAPLAVTALEPDRRTGAALTGDLGIFRYAACAYQWAPPLEVGPGSNPNPPPGALVGGRVEVEPFGPVGRTLSADDPDNPWYPRPRAAVGASFWDGEGGAENLTMWAADAAFKMGPLALDAEYLYDREKPTPMRELVRQGAWVEAGAFAIAGRLEVVARGEWLGLPAGAALTTPAVAFSPGVRYVDRARGLRVSLATQIRGDGHNLVVLEVGAGF